MEFYPANLPVPEEMRTKRLLLRPLRASDVALDYDAVMASAEQLHRWSQSDWPTADFTLAQNLDDLQRHEREHYNREAFTFTVLNRDATRCLGCVYIMPLEPQAAQVCAGAAYAATVGFWARTSEVVNDLDQHLFNTLREWFKTAWAFDGIVFTISPQEVRQAALFSEAGLERRLVFKRSDGRPCWVFS